MSKFLILFAVWIANIDSESRYYVNEVYMGFYWNEIKAWCKRGSRYPASIHSIQESNNIYDQCTLYASTYISQHNKIPDCWIGLYINHINTTHQTYHWMDSTPFDLSHIQLNNLWCSGYPQQSQHPFPNNNNNTTNVSGVVMDPYRNCLKNVVDLKHKQGQLICGPVMYMDEIWWIKLYYLPIIALTILLIYSLYVYQRLKYHLYKMNYHWVIKPTDYVKCTSIALSILFGIMCITYIICVILQIIGYHNTSIIPPSNLNSKYYPKIYKIAGYFEILSFLCYILASLISYLHLVARLQNEFEDNEYMNYAIPSCFLFKNNKKWFYKFMYFIIITIPIVIIWILHSQHKQREIAFSVYFFISVFINITLLTVYLRGLQRYALICYLRENMGHQRYINDEIVKELVNDRANELMIEATRHTIVFGMAMIYNIIIMIAIILFLLFYKKFNWSERINGMIAQIILIIRELLFIQSVYLSFKFSHTTYQKCYCCCYESLQDYCENVTREEYRKYIIHKKKDLNINNDDGKHDNNGCNNDLNAGLLKSSSNDDIEHGKKGTVSLVDEIGDEKEEEYVDKQDITLRSQNQSFVSCLTNS